ncbi:MAG: DUF4245 domain-containing protein [Cumulibacter sp.]
MADTQPYRPRKRGYETIRDMLWSLIPIVVLILGFVYFCGPGDEVTRVDPAGDIRAAADAVSYDLYAPHDLPDAWAPTSSVLLRDDDEDKTILGLSIGYVTPDEDYARFVISSQGREETIDTALANANVIDDPDGEPAEMAGLTWVPMSTSAGRALVAEGSGFVVVIAGTAEYSELRELAGSVATAAPVE